MPRREQLVSDFIDHFTHQFEWGEDMVLRLQSRKPYVSEALAGLSFENPPEFLNTVAEILLASQSEDVMLNLAAPLQVLLETEPGRVIDQVEALAARDPAFRSLLGWLMPSEPSSPVWSRVRDAAGEVPW
jgi:hypothetical protein